MLNDKYTMAENDIYNKVEEAPEPNEESLKDELKATEKKALAKFKELKENVKVFI